MNGVLWRKPESGARRALALMGSSAVVAMSLASFSIAGVVCETGAGICDTRSVGQIQETAAPVDTRRPICQDTDEGSCETGPLGLMIIVR